MNNRDRNHKHTALMLLVCAFGFVYLLAWQFQGDTLSQQRQGIPSPELPPTLDRLTSTTHSTEVSRYPVANEFVASGARRSDIAFKSTNSGTQISFLPLNALPQSFIRLGLISTQGIMIDQKHTIVTTNVNHIARKGDRKTFVGKDLSGLGITADSLTFYNDKSWENILVVMEIVRNEQVLLIQTPYEIYRDDKLYLNSLIRQLTQK